MSSQMNAVRTAERWLLGLGLGLGLGLLAQAGCSAVGGEAQPMPTLGPPWLRDAAGRVVVYRGVNVGAEAEHTPDHGTTLTFDDYQRLPALGVTLVRFLVFWQALEPTSGMIDASYIDATAARIRAFTARGIDVIVDMHQDVFGQGFGFAGAPRWACDEANYAGFAPQMPWMQDYSTPQVAACFDGLFAQTPLQDHYHDALAALAARLEGDNHVIGYDLMNEPFAGTKPVAAFEQDALPAFYARVGMGLAAPVLGMAPRWWIVIEPSRAHANALLGTMPPLVPGQIYAPHYLPAALEQGDYTGDPAPIRADMDAVQAEAARLSAPWMIGHAGISAVSPHAADYVRDLLDVLDGHFASVALWDYSRASGDDYALLDTEGQERPTLSAFVRPYAHRIAGWPISMKYDAQTKTFEASWWEGGVSAPTVIILPARIYPQARLTIGDSRDRYTYDPVAQQLLIMGDGSAPMHSIKVEVQ